ncbi:MAG TPA: penicillin-binding protein 2 [Phycisphaerae bacterium]|nr:penicillin-binding protein 2 [Phycisphaerae bacterium]
MKRVLPGTWRCDVFFGLLMLAMVALSVRLGLLLRDERSSRLRAAQRQFRMTHPLSARRGNLFIRTAGSYVPLATSTEKPYCFIDPFLLRDEEISPTAVAVADILSTNSVALQERLMLKRESRFVEIPQMLTDEQVSALRALRNPAVGIYYEWRRVYPSGPLAGPVAGFCRLDLIDGEGETLVPGGGLELSMQKRLAARDGRRVVLADASRRPIWPLPYESRPPVDGQNIYLTLDANIQGYLETALTASVEKFHGDRTWGTGIVADPRTGEILAMASVYYDPKAGKIVPFDPNQYSTSSEESRTNRAIVLPFEPGSVAKPLFAAAAVEAGVARWDTQFFCENGLYLAPGGGKISDHGQRYGNLTVTDIVVHSSNIGMAKIGEKLGNDRLYEIARRYGFGEPTGVDLPGESPGQLRPRNRWDGYSTRRVPFGQEISATAMQLVMAFCSHANGGLLMRPRLVDRVTDARQQVLWQGEPTVVRRTLSPAVAEQSVRAMAEVVERGTGKACKLSQWTSFGKTGTAQIAGRGPDGRFTYLDGAFVGSFIGGAPVSQPRLICLISIYWPKASVGHYGATVAAPYVKQVLEQSLAYLNVPPDKTPPATPVPPRPRR